MFKSVLAIVSGVIALLGVALLISAQEKTPLPGKEDHQSVKSEAEEGGPKDKAAEKRRDYAALEACLNDLASAKNPEHKYHIENVGPGREIVIDDKTIADDGELGNESSNIDHEDTRSIPADIQADFKRRNDGRARSLKDFKPANPNIKMCDLDKLFEVDDSIGQFQKSYPTAWGFVWAYRPAYSKDGGKAIILFEGGPNGEHGLNWVYMLAKKGKRWEVQWRHCRPRE